MSIIDELLKKAQTLPLNSGCYLMRDRNGFVIYVGKAKKLRSRVTSYFNQSPKSLKTEFMVSHVREFEFIITNSEAESLVLENNLIKEHSPKYNIRLRDDKSYPYVLVNHSEPFPRLEFVRRPKKNKNHEIFGPFPTGSNISQIIRVLTKSFGLRDCSLSEFKSRKTACLYYQMGQCTAPCIGLINKDEYEKNIIIALDFFKSHSKAKKTLQVLKNRMIEFAESEEFEKAAQLRDYLQILENFYTQSFDQRVESLVDEEDVDIWSNYIGENEIDLSVYLVRNGLLLGQKNFHFLKSELIENLEEEFQLKIFQYYSDSFDLLPETIVIDGFIQGESDLALALESYRKVKISGPSKKYQNLIDMCRTHAEESQRVRQENQDSVFVGLNKLKELLSLNERPRILECYDVAIWQGSSPTASQIVFEDGKADKTRYRYYHLQERPEGNNDFAMMREVVSRRIEKGLLPDVFIIDGGIAQVNTVIEVLKEFQIDLPVLGIAKSKELTRGNFREKDLSKSEERLIIPGRSNPYILKKCPSLFKIIVQMRDEAHRFSRKLHHKAESEKLIKSWVDEIKGLNDETRKKILTLNRMTELELKKLSEHDILKFFQLKPREAHAVYEYLQRLNLEHE
jgi:excinuclease ABC subunit C